MTELTFHQIAHELLKKEVEINTLQGTFTGRLLEVGKDVLVIESRGRMRQRLLAVRIDVIMAIFRVEQMPRGPFGFMPEEVEDEHEQQHESSDN
ncbi:hypothetical protein BABA_03134 [Neobacillus bataviensis LMG 21833]|uniref:DUF2642 domain-containing protein n=1 Tax=Neobacillus bataviensis LMG 21833 TaxID=1117379 RepID=K6DR55_9BACI|nr:hypothetical protein [Neobacillus bataviensis]EKN70824.1 hypothetical protein BABA_03134 [Neobacillus bataviensis LMG 21833]